MGVKMSKLNKLLVICLLFLGSVVLSACTKNDEKRLNSTSEGMKSSTGIVPAADQKSGDTTKTGTLTESNGKYFLQEPGGQPEMIESYVVDLSQYVGSSVTVTGQYSGDTLFVGEIQ